MELKTIAKKLDRVVELLELLVGQNTPESTPWKAIKGIPGLGMKDLTANGMIRQGLMEGESNEVILDKVKSQFPNYQIHKGHITLQCKAMIAKLN